MTTAPAFRHPDAACVGLDTNIFFPERGEWREGQWARWICSQCLVREDCLTHALRYPTLAGIWGGTNERQREQLRAIGREEYIA